MPIDVQLAECSVTQDGAKRRKALLEDLLSVRHEEETWPRRAPFGRLSPLAEVEVIQRGNHRLSRSGCRNHQVSVPIVTLTRHA